MFVTLIGLQVAGLVGAIGATMAIVLPTFFLTLTLVRFIPLRPAGRLGKAVRNGLAPISIGLLAAGGLVLARSADTGLVQVLITFATIAAMVMTQVESGLADRARGGAGHRPGTLRLRVDCAGARKVG